MEKGITGFADELMKALPALMRGTLAGQTDVVSKGSLSIPQFLVLESLLSHDHLKMTQIARIMHTSLPAASSLVERLHRQGYVRRNFDKADRRLVLISLTKKGREVVRDIFNQRRKALISVFSKLDEKDRADYLRVVKKIYSLFVKDQGQA